MSAAAAFLKGTRRHGRPRARCACSSGPRAATRRSTAPTACRTASVNDPRVFVSIAADGTVTIVCHRSEMGQGVRTGMPLIVADELDADWARVKVAQAPGDEAKYGNQDTDGSRSTRHFMKPMRECGAAARTMLEAAAANAGASTSSTVEAQNHEVDPQGPGSKLGYGDLAADAGALPVPAVRHAVAQGSVAVPLHRQGHADRRRVRHLHRSRRCTGRISACRARNMPSSRGRRLWRQSGVATTRRRRRRSRASSKIVEIEARRRPPNFHPLGGVAVIATTPGQRSRAARR